MCVCVCGYKSPAERGSSAVSTRQTLCPSSLYFSADPIVVNPPRPRPPFHGPQQLLTGFEVEVEALVRRNMLAADKKNVAPDQKNIPLGRAQQKNMKPDEKSEILQDFSSLV